MSRAGSALEGAPIEIVNRRTAPRSKAVQPEHLLHLGYPGVGMLRELADLTGLSSQVTRALADTYRGPWSHAPGEVFADLAAPVADGADCVDGAGNLLGDRSHVFGQVASTTTLWRLLDERIDATHLSRIRGARAYARERAWAAGAARDHDGWLHLDVDATITIDHSDNKENAAATWKHTFGMHLPAIDPHAPITAVSRSLDHIDLFVAGSDQRIWTAAWEPAFGDHYHGWWPIGY